MYLLDTNVVSELRKVRAGKADANVVRWIQGVPTALLFISAITLFELEVGVLRVERRDPPQGELLRHWLDHNVNLAFHGRVLVVNAAVARRAAEVNVPDQAPVRDALIGATAAANDLTLITRNVKDFAGFSGLPLYNPWEPAA